MTGCANDDPGRDPPLRGNGARLRRRRRRPGQPQGRLERGGPTVVRGGDLAAQACQRRVDCLGATDGDACAADLRQVTFGPGNLEAYIAQDCTAIANDEASHQMLRHTVRTCTHIVQCGVPGDVPTCVTVATTNLLAGVYAESQLTAWDASSCDVIAATVTILGTGSSGGSYTPPKAGSCSDLRCSEGAAGDRDCSGAGCGPCFWGRCNTF